MSRQQLISICVLAALLGGYWFLLAKGELAEIRGLQGEIRGLHSARYISELQAQQLDEHQARAEEVEAWLELVQRSHTVEGEAPEFPLFVNGVLEACELVVHENTPGPARDHEQLHEQSLELSVEGTPEDLLDFLHRMEGSQPFCRVTRLRLEPALARGQVRAALTLTRMWRVA